MDPLSSRARSWNIEPVEPIFLFASLKGADGGGGWSREGVGRRKERTNFCVSFWTVAWSTWNDPPPFVYTKIPDPDRCLSNQVREMSWARNGTDTSMATKLSIRAASLICPSTPRSLGSRIIENKLSLEEWLNAERFDRFLLGVRVTNDRNMLFDARVTRLVRV